MWALFAILTGFVQNVTELLIVRFLLGVSEGGVWPATLILLSHWFPREERARANNLWMLCLPVAAAAVSPLSGLILSVSHENWRLLFIIEGIPPLVWAVVWALFLDDLPSQAKWISPAERAYVEQAVGTERQKRDRPNLATYRTALTSPVLWIMCLAYFFIVIPGYGISSFLPTLLKKSGLSIGVVGVLTALPSVAAIVGLVVTGWLSDRTMTRRRHVIVPSLILGVGVVASALTEHLVALSFILLVGAGYGLYAMLGPIWAIVGQLLPPETAGGGMGLVNAIGNLGGFVGPLIVGALDTATGSFLTGFLFLGLSSLAVVVIMQVVPVREGNAARVIGEKGTPPPAPAPGLA